MELKSTSFIFQFKSVFMDKILASFWLRVSAFILDFLIIGVFAEVFIQLLGFDYSTENIFVFMIAWGYFSGFHSSKWKATLGKKVVGLEVVDYDYKQISFLKATLRYFTSLISSFFPFLYLTVVFTEKKQTIHDMLCKTLVIDKQAYIRDKLYSKKIFTKQEESPLQQKAFRFLGLGIIFVLMIFVFIYIILPSSVFLSLGLYYDDKYKKTFYQTFDEGNINDKRIEFYKKELEKNYANYMLEEDEQKLFQYRIQKYLNSTCIRYYAKEHNNTDGYEIADAIDTNIRNKYVNNSKLISEYTKKEKMSNDHKYEFRIISDTVGELTDTTFNKKTNNSYCDKNLTSDEFYKLFKEKYVSGLVKVHIDDKRRIQKISIKKNLTRLDIAAQNMYKNREKWMREIVDFNNYEEWYKNYVIQEMFKYAIGKDSNIDLFELRKYNVSIDEVDKNGQTALFYAVKSNDYKKVSIFIYRRANIFHIDNYGKSIFDYINDKTNPKIVKLLNRKKRQKKDKL